MTRWTKTLPGASGFDAQTHAEAALQILADTLEIQRTTGPLAALDGVRDAAAHVRAWRKSLPDQGERAPDTAEWMTDRGLIRAAILRVCWADANDYDRAEHLRTAEARLRVLGRRLMAQAQVSRSGQPEEE